MNRRLREGDSDVEGGYVAILTAIMCVVLFGMLAFAVDVGNWYVTGQQSQSAADAAALAGVPKLPGDQAGAFTEAQKFAAANSRADSDASVEVVPAIDGKPTRLRVTITKTVQNTFGGLFGVDSTTITRTAVADYAGPVPMGSPCNEFGNDPDPADHKGSTCAGVNGQLWANVNSPNSSKGNGDAFQSTDCSSEDACAAGVNEDYSPEGYFYTLSLKKDISNLQIEVFDGAFVDVGLECGASTLTAGIKADQARNDYVTDESTRYDPGSASRFCTGDNLYDGNSVAMDTQFTVRDPSESPWNPLSFSPHPGCTKEYGGYSGRLYRVLHKAQSAYRDDIARSFRRWDTVCTMPYAAAGDYLIQVKSNGLGSDSANAGNRFSLRVYSSTDGDAKNQISISGREKMAMFSNAPGATTEFYLARVPSGAAGQVLQVSLFDVGDSDQQGTIRLEAPPDSGVTLADCVASGPTSAKLPTCSFTVKRSTHNGKWQRVLIPIPSDYSCDDTDGTKCWVRLKYVYGSGAAPTDVTAWAANLFGDPARLVE